MLVLETFSPFTEKEGLLTDQQIAQINGFLAALESQPEKKRFLTLDDLSSLPKPEWLIEGVMEVNGLVMLAGPPASYKSFMALDWLLSMASGRDWLGKPTTPSRVLYVLGEGKSSLLKRATAWMHFNKVTSEQKERLKHNFRTTFEVPQLANKASVDNMLAQLAAEKYEPTVIAIDTFARSFVGLDENSQKDTGLWIESAERLRNVGYTVIFLHHTKKNVEFGLQYRGSTAIMGAMDTAITMSANKNENRITFQIVKQKDHDEGDPLYFQKVIVKPDPNEEGSVVLTPSVVSQMDHRLVKRKTIEEEIDRLLKDSKFENDRQRGVELAKLDFGLKEEAAVKRVQRYRLGA